MKICFLENIQPESTGGANTHKLELAVNLAKLGHEIHVLTNHSKKINGLIIHNIKNIQGFKRFSIRALFCKMLYPFLIIKIIKKYNIQIVYSRHYSNGIFGVFIKKLLGIIFVYEVNGVLPEEVSISKKVLCKKISIRDKFCFWLDILIAKNSDIIICVSKGIKEYYLRNNIDEKKTEVIPNGVNTELFKRIDDEKILEKYRFKHGIRKSDNVVLFVGTFEKWQGIDEIIEIAPSIIKNIKNTKFMLVGGGGLEKKYKKEIKSFGLSDFFIFVDRVPYYKVPIYINLADVCLYPLHEKRCSPIKLAEYGACEKPVVVTKIKDLKEYLTEVKPGIPISITDPKDIKNAVIKLLENKELCKRIGKHAREIIEKNYTWKKVAEKTTLVFYETINRN